MPKGIFVTLKDIQKVFGCTQSHAFKIKRRCLDSLDKKRNLTIIDFCELEEISTIDFNTAINH